MAQDQLKPKADAIAPPLAGVAVASDGIAPPTLAAPHAAKAGAVPPPLPPLTPTASSLSAMVPPRAPSPSSEPAARRTPPPLTAGQVPANGAKPIAHDPTPPFPGAANGNAASTPFSTSDLELDDEPEDDNAATPKRVARRRPAGPVRNRIAANDDVPSIGGLIYALEQKPPTTVFKYAAIASAVWGASGLAFAIVSLTADPSGAGWGALLTRPATFLMLAAIVVPIAVLWFLALLSWRAEELRLRSSTMTEVAIRLAEPDRMAEDSIASLGQAVRRQVSFMNEAVGRAIGRAGELEALVHNEVAALERSYEENERRIRGLINELAGERHALTSTSSSFNETLRTLGSEVPQLIDKLSNQQVNLAKIIQGAADNLSSLETTLSSSVGSLETQLGGRTAHLQHVLENYTGALGAALGARTDQLQSVLEDHTSTLGGALDGRTVAMQQMLEAYTTGLAGALGSRTEQLQSAFTQHMQSLDTAIANRTGNLQTVFEEYARALDTTLANRTERIDQQLVERTLALDYAFNERLRLFDDTIHRTTSAIDHAVGERANSLSNALDTHARAFSETISRQSQDLDETLSQGISSVRRTSENITRQSLKAIETLAGQSDMLKNVSENLLGQINAVTGRFENQGHSILKAANALETANRRIDQTLQARHSDLSNTLERLEGKAGEFNRYIEDYSSNIEGSLSAAEQRARAAAEELRQGTQSHRQIAMSEIERLRTETGAESERALNDLRDRLTSVSHEMSSQLGTLNNRFSETSEEMRQRAQNIADEMAREQARMKQELEQLPQASRASADAMRRALHDQLNALDQLSTLTTREAQRRDVSLPMANGGSLASVPSPLEATRSPAPQPEPARSASGQQRSLSSLSASLAQELGARSTQAAPVTNSTGLASPPPAADPRDAWSLGDLLKRASRDEETGGGAGPRTASAAPTQPRMQQAEPPRPAHQSASAAAPSMAAPSTTSSQPFALNIDVLSRALDAATASVIWSRLSGGQRGIMVRSIYSAEGRGAFDEVSRRYPSDPSLQATINRYLNDFERILHDAEAKDSSGRLAQAHMTSATDACIFSSLTPAAVCTEAGIFLAAKADRIAGPLVRDPGAAGFSLNDADRRGRRAAGRTSSTCPMPIPTLHAFAETFPLADAFVISRGAKTEAHIVVAEVRDGDGHVGRGEAVPYARYGETVADTLATLAAYRAPLTRLALLDTLPPGAARNALDCALIDLAAKQEGRPAHAVLGCPPMRPVETCYTLSLGTPDSMAAKARSVPHLKLLKLKLGGDGDDARMHTVRAARPDARLVADANEAWTPALIVPLLAAAAAARIELIEQPLPAGDDAALADITHAVPICADESAHVGDDIATLCGRYDAVNIKLDKAGGLTAALAMQHEARRLGLKIMVGSMVATSLAAAPALLLANDAEWVDLDGPLLLARDREHGLDIRDGWITPADPRLWG